MKVIQVNHHRSSLVVILCLFHTVACAEPSTCFGGVDNAPYLDWVSTTGDYYSTTACYQARSADTAQGFAVHWKLDEENIHLAVAVRAEGWVGFGIGEVGGMKGADMVIFETANPTQVRDAHVLDVLYPMDDVCQDWVLKDAHAGEGFIIFEAYRKLNTTDAQDRAILDDTYTGIPAQNIIAAWGESPTASYHGTQNFGQAYIRWYGAGDEKSFVQAELAAKSDNYFDLTVNYSIKQLETEYVDFCFGWDPDILDQGAPNGTVTVIAAEAFVSEESRPYVHHAFIYGSPDLANTSKTCLPEYVFPIYSYSPGTQPFVLPDNVGYPMGPTSDNSRMQSFLLTMHYNNPDLVPNITDVTTLRFYYTIQPREHELGVLGTGDLLTKLKGLEIPKGRSQIEYTCKSDCSSLALTEPVSVFQEGFHMHVHGLAAVTYQIRNDEIIRHANIDYFDFAQDGFPKVRQQPYMINPGDSFVTKFWFDSENGTVIGISSYQEMNEGIVLYYPAQSLFGEAPWVCTFDIPVAVCNASVSEVRELTSTDLLERNFGPSPSQCSPKATLIDTGTASTSTVRSVFDAVIPCALSLMLFVMVV